MQYANLSLEDIQTLLQSGNTITVTIQPIQEIASGPEIQELLGCSSGTLKTTRETHWVEGAHFFPQQNSHMKYNRPLIEHWIKYHVTDPELHKKAIEKYIREQ